MARPQSIPWEKRVRIFLGQRTGSVQGTAKKHGIARSTVTAIVKEFERQGFASKPLVDVQPALQVEAQQVHRDEVLKRFRSAFGEKGSIRNISLASPARHSRGGLEAEQALGPEPEAALGRLAPVKLDDDLLWHLKGTAADKIIEDGSKALAAYNRACLRLWLTIRGEIEKKCEMTVIPETLEEIRKTPGRPGPVPTLVDALYGLVFESLGSAVQVDASWWKPWPTPDGSVEIPGVRFRGNGALLGASVDDPVGQTFMSKVDQWIASDMPHHQAMAKELQHIYSDIGYIKTALLKQLTAVTEGDVARGICPTCPFPEAALGLDSGEAKASTRKKGVRSNG